MAVPCGQMVIKCTEETLINQVSKLILVLFPWILKQSRISGLFFQGSFPCMNKDSLERGRWSCQGHRHVFIIILMVLIVGNIGHCHNQAMSGGWKMHWSRWEFLRLWAFISAQANLQHCILPHLLQSHHSSNCLTVPLRQQSRESDVVLKILCGYQI